MSIQSRINKYILNPGSGEVENLNLEPFEIKQPNQNFNFSFLNHKDFLKGILKGEQRLANNSVTQAKANLEYDAYYSEAAYLFCLSLPINYLNNQILQLKNAGVYNVPYALVLAVGSLESAIRSNKAGNEAYTSNLSSSTLLNGNKIPEGEINLNDNVIPQQVIYSPSGQFNFFLSSYGTYDNIFAYFNHFLYGQKSDFDFSKQSVVYDSAKEAKISIFRSFVNDDENGIDFFGAYKLNKYSKEPSSFNFQKATSIEELIFKYISAYYSQEVENGSELNNQFIEKAMTVLDKNKEDTIHYIYQNFLSINEPTDLQVSTLTSYFLNRQGKKFDTIVPDTDSKFEISIFPSSFGCLSINKETDKINAFFSLSEDRNLSLPDNYRIRENENYGVPEEDLPDNTFITKNPTLQNDSESRTIKNQNEVLSKTISILGFANISPTEYYGTLPPANKFPDLQTDTALYLEALPDEFRNYCLFEFEKFASARENALTDSQTFTFKSIIKALMTIEYDDLSSVQIKNDSDENITISPELQADLLAFWDSAQALSDKGFNVNNCTIKGKELNAFITNAQYNKAKKVIGEFLDEEATINIRSASNNSVNFNNIANKLFEPKIFFTESLDLEKIDQMSDIEFLKTVCFTNDSDLGQLFTTLNKNKNFINQVFSAQNVEFQREYQEKIINKLDNDSELKRVLNFREDYVQQGWGAYFTTLLDGDQGFTLDGALDVDVATIRSKDLSGFDASDIVKYLLIDKIGVEPTKKNIKAGKSFINYFIYLVVEELSSEFDNQIINYVQDLKKRFNNAEDANNFLDTGFIGFGYINGRDIVFDTGKKLLSYLFEGKETAIKDIKSAVFYQVGPDPIKDYEPETIKAINVLNNFKLKDYITISDDFETRIKEQAFEKFKKDIKNFIIRSKKGTNSFVSGFQSELEAYLKGEDEKDKKDKKQDNQSNSSTNSDDLRFRTYYNMKNLYDSWISFANGEKDKNDNVRLFFNYNGVDTCNEDETENYTDKDLIDYFSFIDRAGKDIGTKAKVDLHFLLRYFGENLDSSNLNTSFHSFLDTFFNHHGFRFHALPYYVPLGAYDSEDLANVFTPIHDTKVNEKAGPAYVCQYLGDASSKPFTKQASETNAVSKSFCLDDDSGTDVPTDMKNGVASSFIVDFGTNENMIFNGVELDQSEFMNTEESFDVITNMTKNYATTTGSNLYKVYTSRSYTAQVQTLGNMMIQPLMFFYLKNVPIFEGSYWITNVSHNIQGNQMSTKFKGVRQPQSVLPSPSETFISLNEDFVEVYGVNVDLQTVEDFEEIKNIERGEIPDFLKKIADKESGGSGDWKAINSLGFIGRYQFGIATLVNALSGKINVQKEIKRNIDRLNQSDSLFDNYIPSNQTIAEQEKDLNVDNPDPIDFDFDTILNPIKWKDLTKEREIDVINEDNPEKRRIFPPGVQDLCMVANLKTNLQRIKGLVGQQKFNEALNEKRDGCPVTKSGLLGAAHLGGTRAAKIIILKEDVTREDLPLDDNETGPLEYFKLFAGFNVDLLETDELATVEQAQIN